jgi:hypothetical protein
VDRLADHVGHAAQQALPGLVGDDDPARLLLLDDVVEVLDAVGAAHERLHAGDREAVHVRRHLLDALHLDAGKRHRGTAALEHPERLERAPVLDDRLERFPVARALVVALLLVCDPEDRQPIHVLEVQLVIRDVVHDAEHRGRCADAEAERDAGHEDERGVALPEPERVAQVG